MMALRRLQHNVASAEASRGVTMAISSNFSRTYNLSLGLRVPLLVLVVGSTLGCGDDSSGGNGNGTGGASATGTGGSTDAATGGAMGVGGATTGLVPGSGTGGASGILYGTGGSGIGGSGVVGSGGVSQGTGVPATGGATGVGVGSTGGATAAPATGGATGTTVGTGGATGTQVGTGGATTGSGGSVTGTGGATTSVGTGGSTATVEFPGWINANGSLPAGSNAFAIQGDWYAFSDGATSDQTGNPYREGVGYCITGEAAGDEDYGAHWGVGMGLDLNGVDGEKLPYEYTGKITGFRIKLEGEVPTDPQVKFVNNLESDVPPFITATVGESVVYPIAEAQVPLDWDVENAGEVVDDGVLYSIQVQVSGADAAGPIDLCITEFEPIYDPTTGPVVADGPYINSDGFMMVDDNAYGIQGPVYAIGDGNSTTQSGNPYSEGKYCVAGEFSGADADWGAGIAFDLNKAPGGGERLAYANDGTIEGFRIGLSGSTPGTARIQFVINEPQEGNQPFLSAVLNTTMDYRIDWAQVPSSWDVSDAGLKVGASIYTVQLYLDGSDPGPFEVCIDEFLPLSAAEIGTEAAPAAAGYTGARTVDEAILDQEYAYWKAHHFRDCGDGSACVPRDEGDCISEGVGYGMLLAVAFDDQAAFDKLWKYYSSHKNTQGVMDWQTSACGEVIGSGSATDGELDAAMALIQANCRWGGTYGGDADTLIGAILNSEVETCSNRTVLKGGTGFGACAQTNPSYFAPGYFKVFQARTGDATWGTLVTDGYALLGDLQAKMNGLVPDWSDAAGNPLSGDKGQYGPDASRTPWRVATDYAWYGEAKAVTVLDQFSAHVDANGGIQRLFTPNSNFRGGVALSGIHQEAGKAQEYTDAWLTTSADDNSYFPGTLRPIYMLLAANRFPNGC